MTTTMMTTASDDDNASSKTKTTMMIHLLPQEAIEHIRAGEVVQCASSAVKELIENSLDAGSTEITVSISQDCKQILSMSDNGCGIDLNDFEYAMK